MILAKKNRNIFMFVIIFAGFNITCMESDSTCIKKNHVHYKEVLNLKEILKNFDETDKRMILADIKQTLMEFFGENCFSTKTQKESAIKVIDCLSSENYEKSAAFDKLTRNEPEDLDLNKYHKIVTDHLLVSAFLEEYGEQLIHDLALAYNL